MAAETLSDIASGAWKPVTGGESNTIKAEVGDVIIGTFVKAFPVKSNFSSEPGTGYELSNVKVNDQFEAMPSAALFKRGNLGYYMSAVQPGDEVRIERLPDDELKNGFMSTSWSVMHRPASA